MTSPRRCAVAALIDFACASGALLCTDAHFNDGAVRPALFMGSEAWMVWTFKRSPLHACGDCAPRRSYPTMQTPA